MNENTNRNLAFGYTMEYVKKIAVLLLSAVIGILIFSVLVYFGARELTPLIDNKNALNLIVLHGSFLPAMLASILLARVLLRRRRVPECTIRSIGYREYSKSIIVVVLLFFLGQALNLFFNDDSKWMRKIFSGNDLGVQLASLIALIFAPLNEEILIRGLGIFTVQFLTEGIIGRQSFNKHSNIINWIAILITSVAFAALHIKQYPIHSLIYIFSLGMYFGYLRIKTESLILPIFAHFVASGIGLTAYFILIF